MLSDMRRKAGQEFTFIEHLSYLSYFRHPVRYFTYVSQYSHWVPSPYFQSCSLLGPSGCSQMLLLHQVYIVKLLIYHPFNTWANRNTPNFLNLHQNLPVCQNPARKLKYNTHINVFPCTTPHTCVIFSNVVVYNEILTWLGSPDPCSGYFPRSLFSNK